MSDDTKRWVDLGIVENNPLRGARQVHEPKEGCARVLKVRVADGPVLPALPERAVQAA